MGPLRSGFMPKTLGAKTALQRSPKDARVRWRTSLELLIHNPSEQHVMTAVPLKAAKLATAIEHLQRITKRLQGYCPDVQPCAEMEAPLQLLKLVCKVPAMSNHAIRLANS